MVDDVSLPIVLFELHDNLTLASGLAMVTIASEPSPGEVVDAENFVFGDVSGYAVYEPDEAGPGTECVRSEARFGDEPETARAVSVPQANHARGCVGLGDTHRIRYAHRGGCAPRPPRQGLASGQAATAASASGASGTTRLRRDPEPGAGHGHRNGSGTDPTRNGSARSADDPWTGTVRQGAQRPTRNGTVRRRSRPGAKRPRHGPEAEPRGRDGQDDPNAKREYRTGHPQRSGPERNGTTPPPSEERTKTGCGGTLLEGRAAEGYPYGTNRESASPGLANGRRVGTAGGCRVFSGFLVGKRRGC